MGEEDKYRKELEELSAEHKKLNERLNEVTKEALFDQLLIQRMKKRKLVLKDRILMLQEFLCDDIIA